MSAACRSCEYRLWARDEMRELRAEVEGLRAQRAKDERIIGRLAEVAVGGTGVPPLVLLDVLEEVDKHARRQRPPLTRDEDAMVARILRETAT